MILQLSAEKSDTDHIEQILSDELEKTKHRSHQNRKLNSGKYISQEGQDIRTMQCDPTIFNQIQPDSMRRPRREIQDTKLNTP
jgi:hypothetical protein